VPQPLAQVYLHLVFSTNERWPFFQDKAVVQETHCYLGGTCTKLGCPVIRVGGVADHVQILFRFGRTISIADLMQELKRESSK